jgi:hypothetical protein
MKISSTRVGVGIDVLGLSMGVTVNVYILASEYFFDKVFCFFQYENTFEVIICDGYQLVPSICHVVYGPMRFTTN